MTLNFPATGDSKVVNFSYSCDVSDLVFNISEQWVDATEKTNNSVRITVRGRENSEADFTIERTATVKVSINGSEPCSGNKKMLTIVQAGVGDSDSLSVDSVQINVGETAQMSINLNNATRSYTALQFDLVLPAGITIPNGSNNKLDASLNPARIDGHTLTAEKVPNEDNTYRFLIYANPIKDFKGTSGALVYATLQASDSMTPGTKQASLESQVATNSSYVEYRWDDKTFNIQVKGSGSRALTWTINNSSEIACNGADGSYHTDLGSSFDITKLEVLEKETWMTDVKFGAPTAQGDGTIKVACAALPPSSQSRTGILRLSYNSEEVGDAATLTQVPCSTLNITYKITKSNLDPCGSNGVDEIGYYKWSGCDIISNTSFLHVGRKPDWIDTLLFGTPDESTKTGKIMVTYGKNDTAEHIWNPAFSYTGYDTLTPEVGSVTAVTQAKATTCEEPVPETRPQNCGEVSFYHAIHPYDTNYHYYNLSHKINASEQEYIIQTYSTFNILDDMWQDVRVEIYDGVPVIEHRGNCGDHTVAVEPGVSFQEIKARHEESCACPNSGEYVVTSISNSYLIAAFENGVNVFEHVNYENFWFKCTDSVNRKMKFYNSDTYDYRGLTFHTESNIGEGSFERCVIVKVYPKVGGSYCTGNTCTDCESSNLCSRNSCITDIITQESVVCGDYKEYLKGVYGHGFASREIYTKPGVSLNDEMLYTYAGGVCDDNPMYVDAVDVYDAVVVKIQDGTGIIYTQKIGKYLGTKYAYSTTYEDGRHAFTEDTGRGGACITDIKFSNPLEDGLHKGLITIDANGYTNTSASSSSDNRYRTRILVPYRKGEEYYTEGTTKSWMFNEGDDYNTYGPIPGDYEILNGHGIFCVLQQDGLGTD